MRPLASISEHYDSDYFTWQRQIGQFAFQSLDRHFGDFIRKGTTVIDFGCGGGYYLAAIPDIVKIGVELNPAAREVAKSNGLAVYERAEQLPLAFADLIVSNHALEHTEHPLLELRQLLQALKDGGTAVFIVPCESFRQRWRPNNVDRHLYTWSPVNLGNLFVAAGFDVVAVQVIWDRWPPGYRALYRIFGSRVFQLLSLLWARVYLPMTQVRIVATRTSK